MERRRLARLVRRMQRAQTRAGRSVERLDTALARVRDLLSAQGAL